MPTFGLGTWRMGEDPRRRQQERAALIRGMEAGVTLIDTAEMYGEGNAEAIVGEAIRGRRDDLFLVSKVLPHHASRQGTVAAAEASLRRLGTEVLDLYLLHWRGSEPLSATLEAFVQLREEGKIRHFGVSNFDTADMEEWLSLEGAGDTAVNQILYHLDCRGPEHRLIPACRQAGVGIMAYSPLDQGRLRHSGSLQQVAARHQVTPEQVALAWLLSRQGVVVIPKAVSAEHLRDDVAAVDLKLDADDMRLLERDHPLPERDGPLRTA